MKPSVEVVTHIAYVFASLRSTWKCTEVISYLCTPGIFTFLNSVKSANTDGGSSFTGAFYSSSSSSSDTLFSCSYLISYCSGFFSSSMTFVYPASVLTVR